MKYIYIGKFFPKKILETIREDSKGRMGYSNHNFEMSIIQGLSKNLGCELEILTLPNVGSFPNNYTKCWVKREDYLINNSKVHSFGFLNIPVINKLCLVLSLTKEINRIISTNKEEKIAIITNTLSYCIELGIYLSNVFVKGDITTTIIVPDLPCFVTEMRKDGLLKKNMIKVLDEISMKITNRFDYFVFLTDQMKDYFKKDAIYIVMEGLIATDNEHKLSENHEILPVVFYSGTILKEYGIMNLVQAFQMLNLKSVELWICGSGDTVDDIKEASKKTPAIKYLGILPPNEVVKTQQSSMILVNPRTSEGEFTKYSFPSKTIEYMISGRPVISNRLPGIPFEYFDYLISPKDESVESLANTLASVLSKDKNELDEIGKKNREFILKNKSAERQTYRIIEMICSKMK